MDTATFRTELGTVGLAWGDRAFVRLALLGDAPEEVPAELPDWVAAGIAAIQAHLDGEPRDLSALPVDLEGQPPFRRRAYEALRATAPGSTWTYGELAAMAGSPGAFRAAGQAVARNPLLLLVPCHRVVAADGPGGWSAFGSPEVKARLMALDRAPLG